MRMFFYFICSLTCLCVCCVQFLGLHLHEHGSSLDHSEDNFDFIYKLLVLIAGVYFFYLMESIFSIVTHTKHHHHDGVSKSFKHVSSHLVLISCWRVLWQTLVRRSLISITVTTVKSCRCSSERNATKTQCHRLIWWDVFEIMQDVFKSES